ncbi:uncharacterized protein Pyn_14756 [Prunus yedoensis var. nudiflora]|uniref:Uncharacterized protein n=1 Tax=Prunus yedoensis var. nudiflora TaxID=2094558 RepID=A0A314ZEM4_PRUYE|nr:uncharacterized protein Pyn_14756 [Prunus yedoensis var. nudiflora]
MPRVVSQNKYLISSIIFLFQQVVKLWAKACACESVDLDPSELPCLYESDFDIEEDHQEIDGERRVKERTGHIRTYHEEGSWQVVVSKPAPSKKREPQSFNDVLSFWKCKEKGQET